MSEGDWTRRSLELAPELAAFVEEALLAAGYEQLSTERRPGEARARLSIYAARGRHLPSDAELAAIFAAAAAAGLPAPGASTPAEPVEERDWNEGFRLHFRRRRIGELVEIVPSWERDAAACAPPRVAPGPGKPLSLVIEAGQAFGTGEHPTTRGCLLTLAQWCRSRGAGFDCLDVGCGSGVLALAARLWGARRVEGYDIDPASIVNAYLNADLNGLAGQLRFRWGEFPGGAGEWDLALANIFLGPLQRLIPRLDLALRPGGSAILSGILAQQGPLLDEAALARGWAKTGETEADGWLIQSWRRS